MTLRPGTAMHLIAPFHTVPSLAASHCAFTGKALRFSKMMKGFFPGGIIEYSNAGSESEADEKVVMLSAKEMEKFYPRKAKDFWGDHAKCGTPAWDAFDERLRAALTARVKYGDFIGHPFGPSHVSLLSLFGQACHVETGIGYPDGPMGAFRIFESQAWQHWHWGKHGEDHGHGTNRNYSYVIPNYYDLDEWPIDRPDPKARPYILFMGRLTQSKGVFVLADIIKGWFAKHPKSRLRFVFAGQGEWAPIKAALAWKSGKSKHKIPLDALEYVGPVVGKARAKLIGRAVASVMPTNFIEPFGGSGVEGMLCGTPLLAVDWGAFTETVQPGINGYRCRTLGDWIAAIEKILGGEIQRATVAMRARDTYSLEACRQRYVLAFTALHELWWKPGWYSTTNTLPIR
jgi:glycosyltransferase involved in cell wall biosynthesis